MPATIAPIYATSPRDYPSSAVVDGKVRTALEVFTYATDAQAAYNICPPIPAGARILSVELNTSVTTGSATLAVGTSATAGKYRAAAALTTADTWVQANLNAAVVDVLTAAEQLVMTVAAATLPASGRLLVRVLYVGPN